MQNLHILDKVAGKMNNQELSKKLDLLKNVNIFSSLKGKELSIVAENSEFYDFGKGDVIFEEGNYSDGLYVIDDGEIVIQKKRNGENINIAQFIKGESFGELDLLENRPMSATAVAESDSRILVFPSRELKFEDVLNGYPAISAQILHELLAVIAGRIRKTNKLLTEKSKWIGELKSRLYNDKLTGLYNRTYLDEEFSAKIGDLGSRVSLVMIKPDNFKHINDKYGHEGGDRALQMIAYSIKSQLREDYIAARYRGDEFAVILPGDMMETVLNFADGIKFLMSILDFKEITGGEPLRMTASIGIAVYPDHAATAEELIKLCFDKMFEARETGGNRVLSVRKQQ